MTSFTSNKQIEVTLKYAFRNKPALLAEGLSKFDQNLIQLMSLDPNLTSLCSIITNGTYTPLVQPTLDSSGTPQEKIEAKVRYEIEYKEYLVETKNVLKFQLLFISYMFQSCDKALTEFIQDDSRYKLAILKRPLDVVEIYNLVIELATFSDIDKANLRLLTTTLILTFKINPNEPIIHSERRLRNLMEFSVKYLSAVDIAELEKINIYMNAVKEISFLTKFWELEMNNIINYNPTTITSLTTTTNTDTLLDVQIRLRNWMDRMKVIDPNLNIKATINSVVPPPSEVLG